MSTKNKYAIVESCNYTGIWSLVYSVHDTIEKAQSELYEHFDEDVDVDSNKYAYSIFKLELQDSKNEFIREILMNCSDDETVSVSYKDAEKLTDQVLESLRGDCYGFYESDQGFYASCP
tara:strand:- start:4599 stop:4955 length:357 start_codon:yes stop_codon:yes gene_type:complete